MTWIVLIAGVALWAAAHLFKRVAPAARAQMGEKGKGLVALALAVSLALIIIGYRTTPFVNVWYPPAVLTHIQNVIMIAAVFVFFVGKTKGRIAAKIRHPMLTGVKIWAIAHLMVNGDLSSILLFGGMLAWAVAEVVLINKSEPTWSKPETSRNGDIKAAIYGGVFYVVVVGIHVMTGHFAMG